MHKIHYKNIEKLFGFTRQTWAKWQKENRPIVKLINNYFDDEDINQLLTINKIAKLEKLDFFNMHGSSVMRGFFDQYYLDIFKTDIFLYPILPEFIKKENVYNKKSLIKFIVETDLDIDKTTALFEISPLHEHEIIFLVNMYKTFVTIPQIVTYEENGITKYKVNDHYFDNLKDAQSYVKLMLI